MLILVDSIKIDLSRNKIKSQPVRDLKRDLITLMDNNKTQMITT